MTKEIPMPKYEETGLNIKKAKKTKIPRRWFSVIDDINKKPKRDNFIKRYFKYMIEVILS